MIHNTMQSLQILLLYKRFCNDSNFFERLFGFNLRHLFRVDILHKICVDHSISKKKKYIKEENFIIKDL